MDNIWFILIGVVYIAALTALVRPGSQGPQIVTKVFDAFTQLVKGIAGDSSTTT